MNDELGTIEGRTLWLERRLAARPADVWRALIDPDELQAWLAPATVDPRVGGEIELRFEDTEDVMHGEILELVAERVLEYTWQESGGRSVVRFELEPDGAGTRLTLRHSLDDKADIAGFGAGWHHHLELLDRSLGKKTTEWDWRRFDELKAEYERRAQQRREAELAEDAQR
jgi:uncharacterized protein YndB with AHSA1/START domain